VREHFFAALRQLPDLQLEQQDFYQRDGQLSFSLYQPILDR
jgi:hypothetical protein